MTVAIKKEWNGYGLSWWRCRCGAARRVHGFDVHGDERMGKVYADDCKRCGSWREPVCIGDPWGGE